MAASLWLDDDTTSNKSRQNNQNNKHEDLFVFGYACKLFRDDDKARDIDKGRLLIPWMGDENLMIDRYDGRGHLYELTAHDSDHVAQRSAQMSEQEEAVEKACEEERYLELHTDVQEAAMYEEEEWKRYYLALQEGYQAVGFSYETPGGGDAPQAAEPLPEELKEEKPFIVPEELQVPPDIQLPTSCIYHARIEKTANFIAKQGIQMEIMVKAKQSGNPQFDFLKFENELNPFYKHVVAMMKSGRYKYKPIQEEKAKDEEDGNGENSSYLHPSLSSATQLPPPPPPPSKPIQLPKVSIHDTSYGALIKSIRKNHVIPTPQPPETTASEMRPDSSIQYSSSSILAPLNAYGQNAEDSNNSYQAVPQPEEYHMVSSLNGPALMERLYGPSSAPNSPAETPPRKKRRRRRRSSSSDSSSSSSSSSSDSSRSSRRRKRKPSPPQPLRAEGPAAIIPPPPEVQPIVDRMALYVAKNGEEFEIVVKGRNDPRFQFLNEYHAFFPYYSLKREIFLKELGKEDGAKAKEEEEACQKDDDASQGGGARSVSFSIKVKPKEAEAGPPGKPKLFEYDSSEGEEGKHQENQSRSESISRSSTPPVKTQGSEEAVKQNMEEKLKDKLASALKERISQSSKEKTIQAERKKKAAMFLTLLKTNQPAESPPQASSVTEDAASLYVGESTPTVVYEYDNQHLPQRVERSRSPRERRHHRRRKSPTPPSAYSLDRRSPSRPSPPPWQSRGSAWSSGRSKDAVWNSRGKDAPRSPVRRDERKKKHKRSKSRTPPRRERSRERTKTTREKSKHKSKDKDREKEKKKTKHSKRSSRDKEPKSSVGKQVRSEVISSDSDSDGVEVLEHLSTTASQLSSHVNGNGRVIEDRSSRSREKDDTSDTIGGHYSAMNNADQEKTSRLLSDSLYRDVITGDSALSLGNSPYASSNNETKESTPQPEAVSSNSAPDFMSKVRAMLKKSREVMLKEDSFSLEDT